MFYRVIWLVYNSCGKLLHLKKHEEEKIKKRKKKKTSVVKNIT